MFEQYKKSVKSRLNWAFPLEELEPNAVINYNANDINFSKQVQRFFSSKNWTQVTLSSITNEFQGAKLQALHFLGWEARRVFMPSMINMCLDGYLEGDIIVETVEFILMKCYDFQHDDNSQNFEEWACSFSREQLIVIIDFIVFMRADIIDLYLGTIFDGDFSPWLVALDKKNAIALANYQQRH